MIGFFRNFAAAKKDGAVQGAIEAIVRWDPEGASEAELRTMEQRLDEIGRKVGAAKVAYDKEKGEADAIKARFDQRLKAIEILQAKMEAEQDPAAKASQEASLGRFVDETMELRDQVKLEVEDEVQAKALLDQLQEAYQSTGAKLKQGRQQLERAARDMRSAEQRRRAAEDRTEAARAAAGLTTQSSSIDTALKAMKDAAAKDNALAGVADGKAKLLTPTSLEKDDPAIAAAMLQAQGGKPSASVGDRIAALRL